MIGGTGHEFYVRNLNGALEPALRRHARRRADPRHRFATKSSATRPLRRHRRREGAGRSDEGRAHRRRARSARRRPARSRSEGETVADLHAACADHSRSTARSSRIADDATQIGQYQVVVLNRGANDGLAPGRGARGRPAGRSGARQVSANIRGSKKPFGDEVQLPYERAGTLIVFKVFDRISYGLVIGARAPDAGRRSRLQPVTHFSSFRRVRASHRAGPFVLGCRDESDIGSHVGGAWPSRRARPRLSAAQLAAARGARARSRGARAARPRARSRGSG